MLVSQWLSHILLSFTVWFFLAASSHASVHSNGDGVSDIFIPHRITSTHTTTDLYSTPVNDISGSMDDTSTRMDANTFALEGYELESKGELELKGLVARWLMTSV